MQPEPGKIYIASSPETLWEAVLEGVKAGWEVKFMPPKMTVYFSKTVKAAHCTSSHSFGLILDPENQEAHNIKLLWDHFERMRYGGTS